MSTPSPWRQDTLLGLGNILAFVEHVARYTRRPLPHSLTVLYFDVVEFGGLNHHLGQAAGDQVLRWLSLALRDEVSADHCYRLRGDEFAAILEDCTPQQSYELTQRVQARLLKLTDGQSDVRLHSNPLHIGVLYIDAGYEVEIVDVLISMETVIQQVKRDEGRFAVARYPLRAEVNLGATIHTLIDRMLELGAMLDSALTQAESDPLTGLPNSRAMSRYMQEAIQRAAEQRRHFAALLVDGDNLRAFNKISYAAGDAMIRQLARLLVDGLRTEDKLARWRLGDEFLILLPDANQHAALHVANRLIHTVREATWQLPVTISVGIALYPEHGDNAEHLALNVELALAEAKARGKNQAALFGV